MKISAVPVSRLSSASRSRICAWIVTSSAVVGSSAISSAGRLASAMAIITRWRMPPDISCGKRAQAPLGIGDADAAEQLECARLGLARATRCDGRGSPRPPARRRACTGIEARHRVLEDHRHGAAAQPSQLRLGEAQQIVGPRDRRRPRRHARSRGSKPISGVAGDRLARPALADDRQRLAGLDAEATRPQPAGSGRPAWRSRRSGHARRAPAAPVARALGETQAASRSIARSAWPARVGARIDRSRAAHRTACSWRRSSG